MLTALDDAAHRESGVAMFSPGARAPSHQSVAPLLLNEDDILPQGADLWSVGVDVPPQLHHSDHEAPRCRAAVAGVEIYPQMLHARLAGKRIMEDDDVTAARTILEANGDVDHLAVAVATK